MESMSGYQLKYYLNMLLIRKHLFNSDYLHFTILQEPINFVLFTLWETHSACVKNGYSFIMISCKRVLNNNNFVSR